MIPTLQLGGLGRVRPVAAGGGGAGFPTYLDATTTSLVASTTSHLVNMPATVAAGDLLICQIALTNGTITTPSGWSVIDSVQTSARFAIFRKVAAGTEGGTTVDFVTSFNSRCAAIVHRIQAGTHDAATPPTLTVVSQTTAAPNPPSHTPAWGAANTLWIAMYSATTCEATNTYPYPNGNTNVRSDPVSSGSSDTQVASCWTQVNGASLDPGAFAKSTSVSLRAYTLSVKPV